MCISSPWFQNQARYFKYITLEMKKKNRNIFNVLKALIVWDQRDMDSIIVQHDQAFDHHTPFSIQPVWQSSVMKRKRWKVHIKYWQKRLSFRTKTCSCFIFNWLTLCSYILLEIPPKMNFPRFFFLFASKCACRAALDSISKQGSKLKFYNKNRLLILSFGKFSESFRS